MGVHEAPHAPHVSSSATTSPPRIQQQLGCYVIRSPAHAPPHPPHPLAIADAASPPLLPLPQLLSEPKVAKFGGESGGVKNGCKCTSMNEFKHARAQTHARTHTHAHTHTHTFPVNVKQHI